MKNLKQFAFALGAEEILTRDQLKHVIGGDGEEGLPDDGVNEQCKKCSGGDSLPWSKSCAKDRWGICACPMGAYTCGL